MSTVEAKQKAKAKAIVPPFAVEADHHRNADMIIQSIPGCRLRSAFSITKTVKDDVTGEAVIPRSQTTSGMPEIPGMQLFINPAELKYVIIDPLCGNEKLCDRIASVLKTRGQISREQKVQGVEPQEGTIDVHRMKTLCREVLMILDLGDMKMVSGKGIKPDLEDIDELPGKYLLNPGSQVQNTQPQYEEDWDEWVANLTRHGG